jgi:FtsX-like permease family
MHSVDLRRDNAMTPVWAWLRLELRRRWRSVTALALLVALSASVVMVATAGARRGGSAVDRLRGSTLAATVLVAPESAGFDWTAVRRLPGVAAVGTFLLTTDFRLNIEGVRAFDDDEDYWYPVGDTEITRTVERPAVIAGRLADPTRVDEAMITTAFAKRHHLHVGDTAAARMFTPRETDAFVADNVRDKASGPRQPLRIVGVIRSPSVNNADHYSVIMTTAAFTAAYRPNLFGASGRRTDVAAVRLTRGEAGLADFQRRLAAVTGRNDIQFQNLAEEARATKKMTGFERDALLLFALAALVASIVVLAQAAARYAEASAADLWVLRTLGMTRWQATAAAAAGPALAAAAGALVACAVAVAASGLFPIGTAADQEPDPGRHADVTVLAGIAATLLVVAAAAAALGARQALADSSPRPPRRSGVAAAAYRLGLPIPVVVGTRFALEPGGGRAAVPVRPALLGAVLGVLGVLGGFTFHAGLVDAASNPQRFGETYQIEGWIGYNGQDFTPGKPIWDAFAADPDVAAINDTRVGTATVNTIPINVFSHHPVAAGGSLPVVTLAGRMPVAPDEVALAPGTVQASGVGVGGTITFVGTARAPMRVTGVAFVPDGASSYAKGAWATADGYRALFPDGAFTYHQFYVALRPGARADAVTGRVSAALGTRKGAAEFGPVTGPREAVQLRNIRGLPLALGGFLALLAVAATGHTLAVAVRRRRHEIAVLRALGMTRRQARLIIVTQAVTITVIGLAFGIPLGVALGRTVWRTVAGNIPVLYVPPLSPLALALVVPTALVVAYLAAAMPGRRASRVRVGDVLRTE